MDNWTLKDSSDSPVEVNGFTDNMSLLWKLQSLDSLMSNDETNTSQPSNDLNQSTSPDLPDDDDLVDKLFRESFALQEMQQQTNIGNSVDPQQQQPQQQANISLEMLLSSPPPLTMNDNNIIDLTTLDDSEDFIAEGGSIGSNRGSNAKEISRKRSRSPEPAIEQSEFLHTIQQALPIMPTRPPPSQQVSQQQSLPHQPPLPQPSHLQRQQQFYSPQHSFTQQSPINAFRQISSIQQSINSPKPTNPRTSSPTITNENTKNQQASVSVSPNIVQRNPNTPMNNTQSPSIVARLPVNTNPSISRNVTVSPTLPSGMLERTMNVTHPVLMQAPSGYKLSEMNPPPITANTYVTNIAPPHPFSQTSVPMNNYSSPSIPYLHFNPSAHMTPTSVPPRPQLRVHFKKYMESLDSPIFDDTKDPMKSDLDMASLRRLTIATLRTLGVYLSFEELPTVDIDDPTPIDSQQILPAAAMQLITTMVLGTSGDKDVSQTMGSQISNGDLVALQRMIVAGLRSKNIVIHTVLNEPSIVAEEATKKSASPTDKIIDLSRVKYEPPHDVTRLFLRLYRYILNMLLSTPDCWPFIQPVPETAYLYHQEIKNPMDLYTIEENVWHGKYTKFARFERDVQLVWKNARLFHRNAGTIPKHADNLEKLFRKIVIDIKKQISRKQQQPIGTHDFLFDPTNTLPEESDFSYPPLEQVFSEHSTVYTISALSPFEPKAKRPKGLTNEKLLYLQLNGPFFQAVERMKSDLEGNHLMVPRFYIAKNRTLLRQIRSQGVLAIFYNVKTNRIRGSKNIHLETDIILAYPASELFDIDQINECTDDFAPKGWIHLRPLRVMNGVSLEVNESIDRDYFRRMFATSKMAIDDRQQHKSTTNLMLQRIVRKILGLPEVAESAATETTLSSTTKKKEMDLHKQMMMQHMLRTKEEEAMETNEGSDDEKLTPAFVPEEEHMDVKAEMAIHSNTQRLGKKEISHEVWQRLFNVCKSKGVVVRNMSAHGNINWNAPNSEGFFKRVYFFDDIVVQAFRQMTMYQRITEVACLMKLKNLPHMAQMREVLYNDNGDVTGLSMERYQTTLKQYAHVHSHHRLSAYQKYDVIYQMLICMKTIHDAGLAHRDLSEVNMMVNRIKDQYLEDGSERVYLYLIDFGKAVFCEANDVREWFVDVPRAEWEYDGDVVPETKEELDVWCDQLPWVKGKPDHGYRMYRSIQTLPKTRSDSQVLPWLIHPQAEDMYSIGVMIWKLFTDTEPWRGILDTDLQGLRYVAEDDYRIQRALEGEVHGELSRQLLLKCLKTRPQDRETAHQILDWIGQESVREGLIGEWKMYSSDSRGARRSKSNYGYDVSSLGNDEEKRKPKRRANTGSTKQKGGQKNNDTKRPMNT